MLQLKINGSVLVRLSKADQVIADEEFKLINAVGKRNGMTPEEIEEIIDSPNEIGRLLDFPSEKFSRLFMSVQLMKFDKKEHNEEHNEEIEYCEKMAMNLDTSPG